MPVEFLTAEDLAPIQQLLEQAAKLSANNATQISENADSITRLEQTQAANADAITRLERTQADAITQLTARMDELAAAQTAATKRIDELAFQVNRWMGSAGERLSRLDAMIERYDGVLAYIMRKEQERENRGEA